MLYKKILSQILIVSLTANSITGCNSGANRTTNSASVALSSKHKALNENSTGLQPVDDLQILSESGLGLYSYGVANNTNQRAVVRNLLLNGDVFYIAGEYVLQVTPDQQLLAATIPQLTNFKEISVIGLTAAVKGVNFAPLLSVDDKVEAITDAGFVNDRSLAGLYVVTSQKKLYQWNNGISKLIDNDVLTAMQNESDFYVVKQAAKQISLSTFNSNAINQPLKETKLNLYKQPIADSFITKLAVVESNLELSIYYHSNELMNDDGENLNNAFVYEKYRCPLSTLDCKMAETPTIIKATDYVNTGQLPPSINNWLQSYAKTTGNTNPITPSPPPVQEESSGKQFEVGIISYGLPFLFTLVPIALGIKYSMSKEEYIRNNTNLNGFIKKAQDSNKEIKIKIDKLNCEKNDVTKQKELAITRGNHASLINTNSALNEAMKSNGKIKKYIEELKTLENLKNNIKNIAPKFNTNQQKVLELLNPFTPTDNQYYILKINGLTSSNIELIKAYIPKGQNINFVERVEDLSGYKKKNKDAEDLVNEQLNKLTQEQEKFIQEQSTLNNDLNELSSKKDKVFQEINNELKIMDKDKQSYIEDAKKSAEETLRKIQNQYPFKIVKDFKDVVFDDNGTLYSYLDNNHNPKYSLIKNSTIQRYMLYKFHGNIIELNSNSMLEDGIYRVKNGGNFDYYLLNNSSKTTKTTKLELNPSNPINDGVFQLTLGDAKNKFKNFIPSYGLKKITLVPKEAFLNKMTTLDEVKLDVEYTPGFYYSNQDQNYYQVTAEHVVQKLDVLDGITVPQDKQMWSWDELLLTFKKKGHAADGLIKDASVQDLSAVLKDDPLPALEKYFKYDDKVFSSPALLEAFQRYKEQLPEVSFNKVQEELQEYKQELLENISDNKTGNTKNLEEILFQNELYTASSRDVSNDLSKIIKSADPENYTKTKEMLMTIKLRPIKLIDKLAKIATGEENLTLIEKDKLIASLIAASYQGYMDVQSLSMEVSLLENNKYDLLKDSNETLKNQLDEISRFNSQLDARQRGINIVKRNVEKSTKAKENLQKNKEAEIKKLLEEYKSAEEKKTGSFISEIGIQNLQKTAQELSAERENIQKYQEGRENLSKYLSENKDLFATMLGKELFELNEMSSEDIAKLCAEKISQYQNKINEYNELMKGYDEKIKGFGRDIAKLEFGSCENNLCIAQSTNKLLEPQDTKYRKETIVFSVISVALWAAGGVAYVSLPNCLLNCDSATVSDAQGKPYVAKLTSESSSAINLYNGNLSQVYLSDHSSLAYYTMTNMSCNDFNRELAARSGNNSPANNVLVNDANGKPVKAAVVDYNGNICTNGDLKDLLL